MAYEHLLVKVDGRVATLTLNRPERMNALNPTLENELGEALEAVGRDDSIGVVVLTGAGRAFCSGADVQAMSGGKDTASGAAGYGNASAEEIRRGFSRAQRMILGIQRLEKPVIGMINGAAVGAGFDMSCACDMRVGSTNARFMAAYIRVGLFPGFGGTWLYARALGLPKAAELLFTGDFLEAEEAHRLGFLNKLVPPEKLEEATMEVARKIANGPPIAMRLAKLQLYKGLEMDLETAMQVAAAFETITLTSEDHKEGAAAFREKRPAKFKGR